MQCRYGTGGAAVWLTGVQYAEDTGPLVLQGSAQVQVSAILRAATPFLKGRGNKALSLPVPIVLQFPDWMEATRFCHETFWDLPDDGELYFKEQWGTDQLAITYPNAALQGTEIQRIEATVTLTHTFIVTGPPALVLTAGAPLRILTEDGESITTES